MTTPDIDYDKALGVVAPRFKLLEKTEDDVVWAALPKLDQEVLTQLKDHDEFEPGLVNMTKALGDMQKEAGKFLAGWHAAQERRRDSQRPMAAAEASSADGARARTADASCLSVSTSRAAYRSVLVLRWAAG